MANRRAWKIQQDNAILQLVQKYGTKKWAIIASNMSNTFNLKGRSGKQCRQRWQNHLNSSINKNPWSVQEEKIIFDCHRMYGNKWTEIAKFLDGRTDNSIKNHFYSTLRKTLRRISKMFGHKNSTSQMRDIKPSVLSKIFSMAEKDTNDLQEQNSRKLFQNCKLISEKLIQFSQRRNKLYDECSNNLQISEQDNKNFSLMMNQIQIFNKIYQKEKNKKKQKNEECKISSFSDIEKRQQKQQYGTQEQNLISIEEQMSSSKINTTTKTQKQEQIENNKNIMNKGKIITSINNLMLNRKMRRQKKNKQQRYYSNQLLLDKKTKDDDGLRMIQQVKVKQILTDEISFKNYLDLIQRVKQFKQQQQIQQIQTYQNWQYRILHNRCHQQLIIEQQKQY